MQEQFILLQDLIEKRIQSFDKKRMAYRKSATRAYFSTAMLAALSTVLLGLNIQGWAEPIRIMVLLITASITLLNSFNAFYNYKELWVANNNALNKLYALNFTMDFFSKGSSPITEEVLNGFKNEYQSILDEINQVWHKSRADNHKPS